MSAGILPVPLALAFILGANLCADVMAMLTSMGDPPEGRRVQIGNMIFRAIGVVVVLPFLSLIAPELPQLSADAMRQIVSICHKHNVVVGNPHVNAKNHKRLLEEGYRFLMSAPLKSYGVVGMAREMAGY